jgi:hypothetical protein
MEDSVVRAFQGMEDALVNFVKTGKLNFNDLANSILNDLIRIQVRQSIVMPLSNAMSTGGISSLFGMSGSQNPAPVVDASPAVPAFAGGGYTGSGSRSGGVDGMGGFPAILHPNETVVDHTKGGGGVSVNIINNTNSSASATERTDGNGNRSIDVVIGDVVAKQIGRIGSSTNQAIRSTFKTSPALVGR